MAKDKNDDEAGFRPVNEINEENAVSAVTDHTGTVLKEQTSTNLWDLVKQFIIDNVELDDEREYDVLTGWVFSSHLMDEWYCYPYLYVYGIKKSGKTRLQNTLKLLTLSPVTTVNSTVSVLFREIANEYHTMFIYELSLSGKLNDDKRIGMIQILNAGYKKGGKVKRSLRKTKGGGFSVEEFDVGGFKCMASVDRIPETLRSRCITIRMRKTRRRFPMRIDEARAKNLDRLLFFWARKNKGKYKINDNIEHYLFEISGRDGRLVEIFSPIYVVAPAEKKPILIDYLRELGENELQEELASFDCEVLIAILKVYENNGQSNWFATDDVRKAFNEERSIREQYGSKSIGRQIGKFGFKHHRSAKRKGWKWNEKLVEKLKERYPLDISGTVPIRSQTAQTSLENLKPREEIKVVA